LSPWLVYLKKIYYVDEKTYFKSENDIFLYGYSIAQMLVVLLIVFIFYFSTIWILCSAIVYFLIRHALDSFILLVDHKKEIESGGTLVN
jgi:hypothetical protein